MSVLAGQRSRPTSPYKGLAPFEDSELDEQLFFGREQERQVIVANVVAARVTVLYGATGVGKSSVLRAGVARDLRTLTDEPLVVVCDAWSDAPAATLAQAVAAAASIDPGSLSDTIEVAAAEHQEIYLLLDQVEEYFVYHGSDSALGNALAELVTRPELPVHILIAIREDALARLDSFKRQLPSLLANRLHLEHLSVDAGRRAILGPIERFAALAPDAEAIAAEPELVDAVLAGVGTGTLIGAQRGRGSTRSAGGRARIETPYLQVVMQRLWEVEREAGSDLLRHSTLERLGGPARIVGEHLERALDALSPAQKQLAARVFNHLVTPSGMKIAHGTSDLAGYVAVPRDELELVLQTLARERILRPVLGVGAEPAYEIFHDVLADAVLAWRADFDARAAVAREREAARRRHRRLLVIVVVAALALAAMGAATLYALSQRDQAQQNEAAARAALTRAKKAKDEANSKAEEASKAQRKEKQQEKIAKASAAKAIEETAKAKAALEKAAESDKKATAEAAAARKSEENATEQAAKATREEGRAQRASKAATAAKQLAQHQAEIAREKRVEAEKAVAAERKVEKVARSQASAYQSQAALESAPENSLRLAVKAATFDPTLRLVESTLRRALLATRGLHVLQAGDKQTRSSSFIPDGALILTAGDAGARVFRADSGMLIGTLATASPVDGAAFSADGKTIVTAEKGRAELWSTDSRTRRKALFQPGATTHATFSADGRRLLTWGAKSARVWDVATAAPLSRRLRLPSNVTGVALSPDGTSFVIATGSAAAVYDTASATLLYSLPEPTAVIDARFSAAGDTIATAGVDGVARLWNAQGGSPRCATPPSDGPLTGASFSHDGASLLTLDSQGDTRIWNTRTCAEETQLIGHLSKVVAADFSPNDQYVVTAGRDRSARIFSLPDGTQQATLLGHSEALASVTFSPDGTKVATASFDGTSRVWDARIDRPESQLGAHSGSAGALAISPDGSTVASVGVDGYVRLWNLETRQALSPIMVGIALDDVAFSPDGRLIAAAGADGSTRLWKLKGRTLISQFSQLDAVRAIAFSPDGKWLATAGSDNNARLFRLGGGASPVQLVHAAVVNDVAFSPDSDYVATATADGLAQIWQIATRRAVMTFTGHSAALNSVSFSPDGKLLVTASLDHDARIWSVATGKTLRVLEGHAGSVSSAAFSADGRWVVTAGPRAGGIWPTVESGLAHDRLFFISDDQQRLNAAVFAPTTLAPATWMLATAAANGRIATYICALCARTPELLHLARQRIAQLEGR
jgi:WD40 repeat protein